MISQYQLVMQLHLNLLQIAKNRAEEEKLKNKKKIKPKRKPKGFWVRPWTTQDRRLLFGNWDNLLVELRVEDTESYFNYLRMPPHIFDEILHKVEHRIKKKDTHFRYDNYLS